MRLTLLLLLGIFVFQGAAAQKRLDKQLDSITDTKRAKAFIKSNQFRQSSIITFNEEKHKSKLAQKILSLGNGGTKVIKKDAENIHYKVLEKRSLEYYRVQYIFLDGTKMSIAEIHSLRPKLIDLIESGVPFKDIAARYSMDQNRNRGGDSGWFKSGDMLPEFEAAVMDDSRMVDDVFTVDVESNMWYYVVLKSHERKSISEAKVLKVVEVKK